MKYGILLPDGAADVSLEALGGRTPLQAARTPVFDEIARTGRLGRVLTCPMKYIPGTDVGTLSLLGYDPDVHYTGRAPIEAAAQGLATRPGEIIYRCNFVTVREGRMADFTAGHIAQDEANALVAALNEAFAGEGLRFYPGVSYRNLMIIGDADELDAGCTPPHNIAGQLVAEHGPVGPGAARIVELMQRAEPIVAKHAVNRARAAAARAPVTGIWLWGQGKPMQLPGFAERFGKSAALITAVDIIRGLGRLSGMELIEVPGATGYLDTNYAGKGEAAAAALARHDVVIVHVEAPDEAGHLGDAAAKVEALERTDELVAGPLLAALRAHGEWRMLVAADHPTPCTTQAHSSDPPLFAYAGTGVAAGGATSFDEPAAVATGDLIEHGQELMGAFLG